MTLLALLIFGFVFILITTDLFDKALVSIIGALAMIILGILTPEEAISSISVDTIFLLMGMMILVHIASKSGIFEWLNVKIAAITKGNPFAIFLLFSIATNVCSAFLDNVTTILLIVPLTIELVKGMGRDPKPYIFAEIIFANMGGALTLIGDGSNIIIGGAANLSFMQFLQNMYIPIGASVIFTIAVFSIVYWSKLKPISGQLSELLLANVILKKVQYKFVNKVIHKDFVIKVLLILLATIAGFILQREIGLPNYLIAFTGAMLLGFLTSKRVEIKESLEAIEWTTLFFFAGLFVMVAGVEKTGVLQVLSDFVAGSTGSLFQLSLIILWSTGILSMVINNIPFVTVMVPVIFGIQAQFPGVDTTILWWALSMGACLGGSATVIGASANVVACGCASQKGVNISFMEYLKFSMPLTLGILVICSIYLFFVTT